jgi:1-acyl-sn-glycerol-3-phosphate acyltransferase
MLKLARVLLLGLLLIFWFLFGLLLCLVRPRHPNNVYVFARMYHAVCPLIGLKVRVTVADEVKSVGPAVYVCNHQSNYDIFTVTGAVQPGVVAVGKKSLLWLPFFGLIFWLSGNVLIDRSTAPRHRHHRPGGGSHQASRHLHLDVPGGTRSQGAVCCRSRRAPSTPPSRPRCPWCPSSAPATSVRSISTAGTTARCCWSDGPGVQQGARRRRHPRALRHLPGEDGSQAGGAGWQARPSAGGLSPVAEKRGAAFLLVKITILLVFFTTCIQ